MAPPIPPAPAMVRRDAQPWGFWATLAWAAVALYRFTWEGVIAMLIFVGGPRHVQDFDVRHNGQFYILANLFGAVCFGGLSVALALMREGIPVREYLALRWPEPGNHRRSAFVLISFFVVCAATLGLFDPEKDRMVSYFATASSWAWFLPIAACVIDPISEEIFFRGFMFKGLRQSAVGAPGAIVIVSLVFAFITAGSTSGPSFIFAFGFGILLAVVRETTKSVYLCAVIHGILHLVSLVEMFAKR